MTAEHGPRSIFPPTPSHGKQMWFRTINRMIGWRRRAAAWAGLAVVALGVLASEALARINVVTLPGRDTVQLTIYNSADLTLVKETRVLTFRRG